MSNEKMLITIGVVAVLALAVLGGVVIANNNSSNNNGVTDSSNNNIATDSSNNNNAASAPAVEQAKAPAAADNNSNSESASPASESAAVTEEVESDSTCIAEVGAYHPELSEEVIIETMAKDMMVGAGTNGLLGQYTDADGKLIESEADLICAMEMIAESFGMTYEEYSKIVLMKVFEIMDANGYAADLENYETDYSAVVCEHIFDENGACTVCGEM